MNPTVANIVEQARMGYLALRTGDYRDLRRAVDYLTAFPSIPRTNREERRGSL